MPQLHARTCTPKNLLPRTRQCPRPPPCCNPHPLGPQVPPSVRTGEDAVRLFCSSSAKSGLIVYCNLNPDGPPHEYNPYDLMVVDRARADPRHHYVLTQARGMGHVARDTCEPATLGPAAPGGCPSPPM